MLSKQLGSTELKNRIIEDLLNRVSETTTEEYIALIEKDEKEFNSKMDLKMNTAVA